LHECFQRYILVQCKREKLREFPLKNTHIPSVPPEIHIITHVCHTVDHHDVVIGQRYDISPPEGTPSFSVMRWNRPAIKRILVYFHPWKVFFVIELMQKLHQWGSILISQINDV
jgi:hypothetical protein